MEAEVAPVVEVSHPSSPRTPDLRQRQRDRMSPRRPFAKGFQSHAVGRDQGTAKIGLSASQRSKGTGNRTAEYLRKKQDQEEARQENIINGRTKGETEDGRINIAPDGGSAGREGRQFTVSKVGNNGRIYLRPTIRPAHQRYPQPAFTFPITPPSTAGLETFLSQTDAVENQTRILTPRSPPTPGTYLQEPFFVESTNTTPKPRHKRAYSYSTIDEQHATVRESDAGVFKVIIERPGGRPKYNEVRGIPTLEVPIPSYKLGTPRFSVRGTAFLRNSSHTGTEEVRSSVFSGHDTLRRDQNSRRPTRILSRRHSDASPQPMVPALPSPNPYDLTSLPSPRIVRQRVAITPDMFDALTFKPACDHPSIVRYSGGGGIRAATPARLVAEITSPTFVDYDLLSDFFLTFRSFLDTTDLLYMLIARLKWALSRDDETGTIVRVRTFVAMRHWILNYFLDDYVVDYELRKSFCDLLNNFANDLPDDKIRTKVPLKILGELKKCWRRVCALYWDGSDFDTELGPDIEISPGGVAGSRNPKLDPSFWQKQSDDPPRLEGIIEPDFIESESAAIERGNGTFFAAVSRAGHLDSHLATPQKQTQHDEGLEEPPLSPTSILSEEVVSCSFPTRGRAVEGAQALGAHPVVNSLYENGPHVATTPKTLTGKRVRPAHAHKRSGSFSDSFRDQRAQHQPVQKVIYKSTEILLALPYAGSLVRGNLFPPGQAFVDVVAPSTPAEVQRATTLFPGIPAIQKGPSAMSGPGMKRLLGSVRRALSTRNTPTPNSSPTQGSFPHIPPLGIRGATINRLPGTAVVPQARPRNNCGRSPMRIDLLGAEVAEDFKRAVQEDAEAEAEAQREEATVRASSQSSHHGAENHYSTVVPETTFEPLTLSPDRTQFVSGVTAGSKSIVIVDDTLQLDLPVMRGALPVNASVDTFADAFMQPSGGPTPPSTPPELPLGTPRRSSHLLGHSKNRTLSVDATPSLVVDSRPSGEEDRSLSHRLRSRPSTRSRATPYKVKKSVSLRRYASYQSGFTHHRSERSFDATTFSETVDFDRTSREHTIPQPLRVLRRRPGGDLRAVTNVGDLDAHPLRRPMSTGSLVTYSDSVRSSYLLRDSIGYVNVAEGDADASQDNRQRFSLGALAEASPKRPVSLFSTHSSQPIMRPSFEKEARFLAQIPDDADDDGGVESTLLKLEGKYEKRQSDTSQDLQNRTGDFPGHGSSFGVAPHDMSTLSFEEDDEEEKRRHRHEHIVEKIVTKSTPAAVSYRPQQQPLDKLKPTVYQPRGMQQAPSAPVHRSVESYNSIPLLERGLTDDEHEFRSHDWTERSILREPSKERAENDILTPDSSHPNSFNFIDETESMKDVITGQLRLEEASIDHSFLESDSDISDLSSELSLEVISRTEYMEQESTSTNTLPGLGISTVVKELSLPSHPLRQPSSPKITLSQALRLSPQPSKGAYHDFYNASEHQLPPSPQTTPTGLVPTGKLPAMDRVASPSVDPLRSHGIMEASRKTSVHLPFILAFDSQILAQQFTLIEKDALNEIDWKDLIEMRWRDRGNTESRSWVEFLRASEPHGVEVVIARFNLMVKWAVSECVLTLDLNERVRCIIKYIHIAAQCRKYRNFATMTQLTVALTSKDITRLTDTWAYVPESDLKTLRELEALVTPTSNFHSLRAEMEGSGAEQGCIPFVGIYTHDLLVNQERPSQIASTPTTEPLTNFERCRTDAAIVKNLLRLLEASQLYRFLPIEGVTERCLWMAALSDEEIMRYGNLIQRT